MLTSSEVKALLLAKVDLPRSPPFGNPAIFPLSVFGDDNERSETSPSLFIAMDGENIDLRAFFLLAAFLVGVFVNTSLSLREIAS